MCSFRNGLLLTIGRRRTFQTFRRLAGDRMDLSRGFVDLSRNITLTSDRLVNGALHIASAALVVRHSLFG